MTEDGIQETTDKKGGKYGGGKEIDRDSLKSKEGKNDGEGREAGRLS